MVSREQVDHPYTDSRSSLYDDENKRDSSHRDSHSPRVPTKPSRDDSAVWKAEIFKTQSFENSIKMEAVHRRRLREAKDVEGTTESNLDIPNRRPAPPRGIWGSEERVG